jgi:hypothetical protein
VILNDSCAKSRTDEGLSDKKFKKNKLQFKASKETCSSEKSKPVNDFRLLARYRFFKNERGAQMKFQKPLAFRKE